MLETHAALHHQKCVQGDFAVSRLASARLTSLQAGG